MRPVTCDLRLNMRHATKTMFVYVSRDLRSPICDQSHIVFSSDLNGNLRLVVRSVARHQNKQQLATCDQSQVAYYATAKRTITCDQSHIAGLAIGKWTGSILNAAKVCYRQYFSSSINPMLGISLNDCERPEFHDQKGPLKSSKDSYENKPI